MTRTLLTRRVAGALCAAAAGLAAPAQAAAPRPTPLASIAAPSRVLVEATEFRFTLSRTTVKPGPAIVQLAIRGEDPHDLKLVPASRAKLNAAIAEATWPHFRFELKGNAVTHIEQVFTP